MERKIGTTRVFDRPWNPLIIAASLAMLTAGCAAQVPVRKTQGPIDVDHATREIVAEMMGSIGRLEDGASIAVMGFVNNVDRRAYILSDAIETSLMKNLGAVRSPSGQPKFELVNRDRLAQTAMERELVSQASPFFDQSKAVALGGFVSAKVVITGFYTFLADEVEIVANALDVERDTILRTSTSRIAKATVDPAQFQVKTFGITKDTIAVYPFKCHNKDELDAGSAEAIQDGIVSALSRNSRFKVLNRRELDNILAELQINKGDFVDPEKRVLAGRMIGAKVLVMGSYFVFKGEIKVHVEMVDTETTQVLLSADVRGKYENLMDLIEALDRKIQSILA